MASEACESKAGWRVRGEAASVSINDEASCPRLRTRDTGQALLAHVLARRNLQRALKRVKANRGGAGVDGQTGGGGHVLAAFQRRVRQLIRRNSGRSVAEVIAKRGE